MIIYVNMYSSKLYFISAFSGNRSSAMFIASFISPSRCDLLSKSKGMKSVKHGRILHPGVAEKGLK